MHRIVWQPGEASNLAVGIMSGTSGDGVSVALTSFEEKKFSLIDYKTYGYPKEISKKIQRATELKVSEISALNFQLGEIFSSCCLNLLRKNKIKPEKVLVVGSHGQTIFHGADQRPPSTFQIGESAMIAEKTGAAVVSDFRVRDVSAGGEGAPLIPFFDHYFFGDGPIRSFQNIGGIANVTIVGKKMKNPLAFDTGPGNCLIDWTVKKISGGKIQIDKEGKLAEKGQLNFKIIQEMMDHPFFRRKPPKSTGRELFNEKFLPRSFKRLLRKRAYDALNTITYFTAFTISESYKKFVYPYLHSLCFRGGIERTGSDLTEVIVSGGGALNRTLLFHLRNLFQPIPVNSIESFGIHPQAKEPIAFAFFALWAIQNRVNHSPSCTGARKALILGKITPSFRYFSHLKKKTLF